MVALGAEPGVPVLVGVVLAPIPIPVAWFAKAIALGGIVNVADAGTASHHTTEVPSVGVPAVL